jgi:hypothetical protein
MLSPPAYFSRLLAVERPRLVRLVNDEASGAHAAKEAQMATPFDEMASSLAFRHTECAPSP